MATGKYLKFLSTFFGRDFLVNDGERVSNNWHLDSIGYIFKAV